MSNRALLQKIIKGGETRHSRRQVYSVCNSERQLISDEAIDADEDMTIEVHCNELQQLQLQDKAANLQRSKGS